MLFFKLLSALTPVLFTEYLTSSKNVFRTTPFGTFKTLRKFKTIRAVRQAFFSQLQSFKDCINLQNATNVGVRQECMYIGEVDEDFLTNPSNLSVVCFAFIQTVYFSDSAVWQSCCKEYLHMCCTTSDGGHHIGILGEQHKELWLGICAQFVVFFKG